jgi:hypothetical protein
VLVPHNQWNRFVKECRDRHDLPRAVSDQLTADESAPIRVKKIVVPYGRPVRYDDDDDGSGGSARISVVDSSRQALATHLSQAARLKRLFGSLDLGGARTHAKSARYMFGSIRLRP